MSVELVHEQLSRRIIGSAIVVVNELKPGLDEKLYERALILKLYIRVIRVIRGYILWRLEGDRVRLTDRPKAQIPTCPPAGRQQAGPPQSRISRRIRKSPAGCGKVGGNIWDESTLTR